MSGVKAWKQLLAGRRLLLNKTNRFAIPLPCGALCSTFTSPFPAHPTASLSTASSIPPVDDGAGQPGLSGVHDVGGLDSLLGKAIDLSDPALQDWESQTHALLIVLVKNGYLTTDELRRHIESMSNDHYVARSYYCKWATSMALGLIERGVINYTDLDDALLGERSNKTSKPKFSAGQRVRVKPERSMARWRKPHLRTPGYIFGVHGTILSWEGCFPDPSFKAFRSILKHVNESQADSAVKEHLYRVRFLEDDVWPEGKGLTKDTSLPNHVTIDVEIYENWLENEHSTANEWERNPTGALTDSHSPMESDHHHHHDHDHDHDHEHLPRAELEQRAIDLETSSLMCASGSIDSESKPTAVVGDRLSGALIELLSKPEHLGSDLRKEIRKVIDAMESIRLRADGVTLVVRAWMDPAFEERLLNDAASAAMELGIQTANATTPTKLKVVKSQLPTESERGVHNLITCTLCSCYPLSLLGLSPKWYKSRTYRARAVREPRAMLQDSFGLKLSSQEWTIRVHDSTADLRYIVLPPRPPNTENWTEDDLRQLVTRDTMIGVALPDGILTS